MRLGFLLVLVLSLLSCKNETLTYPGSTNKKYIIISSEEGFAAKEIHSSKMVNIPAVIQLDGKIYLPFFSSYPSFNKKVVEGFFIPDTNYYANMRDTIFRVTKHLRDTTFATVGQ